MEKNETLFDPRQFKDRPQSCRGDLGEQNEPSHNSVRGILTVQCCAQQNRSILICLPVTCSPFAEKDASYCYPWLAGLSMGYPALSGLLWVPELLLGSGDVLIDT